MNLKLKRLIILYVVSSIVLLSTIPIMHLDTLATAQSQGTEYPWPMYLHDLEHTGYTESPAPIMPSILWNYTMEGTSWGPVVAYGKVFLGSTDKKVYAIDQMTGEKIWEFSTGKGIYASPAVADGKVFIGSADGKVYALDQSSGSKIWEFNIGAEIGSSPAVADNRVYVGAVNGGVYALDASTGVKLWNFTTGGAILYSSPAIAGEYLFIGSSDGYLYALDKKNGAMEWKAKVSDGKWYVVSSPAISNDKVFIGSLAHNKTYAFDIYTGSVVWGYLTGGRIWASPSVAYGKVFIGSADGKVYALDQSSGSKIWEFNTGKAAVLPLAVADRMVVVSSGDGKLYALHQSNGSKIWDILLSGAKDSGTHPVIADGKIYVVFGNTLYAIISRSTLTISLSQTRTNVGSTVTIEGDLYPPRSGVSITIQWRREGETAWNTATVTTGAAGHYTYNWRPDVEGSFELMARWGGDASTLASQSGIQLIIVGPSPPLISMEVLMVIIVVAGIAVALIAYIKKRPKKPKPSGLKISADPKEIFADGESTSNITVELVDAQGNQISADKDINVSLSTTGGKIISSIIIPKGKSLATATLTSSTNIGTVYVTASARGLKDAKSEVFFKEKKRYCMYCGKRMPLEAKICPSCGNTPPSGVDTKICKNCGTIIPEVARFCRECGANQTQ